MMGSPVHAVDSISQSPRAISTNLPDKSGAVLENTENLQLGDRWFLKGSVPDKLPDPWDKNPKETVYIPFAIITQIIPYDKDNLPDYLKAQGAKK
jgi:hypothetical protein